MSNGRFAKRSLGQNFLVDRNYVQKIIRSLDLKDTDTVIEIGPGRGAITEYLVGSGARVIAIELDREFVPMLWERFSANDNFSITEADATKVNFEELISELPNSEFRDPHSIKLVANLPYYISTAILQHLETHREVFSSLVLMFQREVVDRILAAPGSSERGYLSVIVGSAFDVTRLFDVPPNAFRPVPKVTSSVARLTPKPASAADAAAFRQLLSAAFAQKRKTLFNNLKRSYPTISEMLERSGIDGKRRAESLTLDEWLRLYGGLEENDQPDLTQVR
ncbi:MAG: 16S rRNA (adenine(1518)-N(6)/adenine(1519)-N(6))-dimethyltransferase RsmA [Pyrinomonadaceae bacterium]